MRNIMLKLSYDGTRFCGWQRQDHADSGEPVRTVQGELEKCLSSIHGADTAVNGSGRTDSGVHAAGQVVNFISPLNAMPASKYIPALNSMLPQDIRVITAEEADESFHARFSAVSRTYRYMMCCGRQPYAYETPYVWYLKHIPDTANLNEMASCLFGEIDCTTFAAAGDPSHSKFRYLEKAVFYPEGGSLVFEITANAFLWKMVRSITGTLIHCDKKDMGKTEFADILRSCDRRRAGPTAPPHGLYLWSVCFSGQKRH